MIYNRFNPTAEDSGADYGMFSDLVPGGATPATGYTATAQPTAAEVFAAQSKGPLTVNPDGSTTYAFDDSGMAPTSVQTTAVPTTTAAPQTYDPRSYPTSAELAELAGRNPLGQYQMMRRLQAQYGRNWNLQPGQTTPPPGIPTIGQLMPGTDEYGTPVTGVYNPTAPVTPTTPTTGTPAGIDPVTGLPIVPAPTTTPTTTPTTPTTPTTTTPAPPQPTITDMIRATPGYQFQYNEGLKALNANAYARGLGNSGATFKALEQFGQNHADNYYQQYLTNVMGVAEQGRGAASAIAGSGGSMGSGVAGAMGNAAQAIQNGANGNITAINQIGNANASMWQGIGSAVGGMAGSVFGSSYPGGAR